MQIIEVKNLSKKFGQFKAVDNISFDVKKGEIVGLLGPNGAGKTTTTQMMLGLIEPTGGEIKIFGKNMPSKRVEILKQVNFSSSYVRLPWHLTVFESLYVFSFLYEVENAKSEIDRLLDLFGILKLKNKTGGYLSSGEQTRVHLCKALINKPKILFLDEPTSSLDPDVAKIVREYLKKIQKEEKVTIFLTSHNMAEVEELCDRVIFLSKGRIIAEDTPLELARKITKSQISLMMIDGQKRTLALAKKNNWRATAEDRFVTIILPEQEITFFLATLADKGVEYKEISIEKPSLEDYFLEVVKK